MGLVKNVEGLIACRVLLGLFEAGIVPGRSTRTSASRESENANASKGAIYLISMYYRRYEVQWRMSLFFSASIIAGAFSGLLAFAIAKMSGVGGLEAWRWYVFVSHTHIHLLTLRFPPRIFILEGLLTVVAGVVAKWWIPDWPETAKFLNDDERSRLVSRLADDSGNAKMDHLDKLAWRRILADWKMYVGTLAYFGVLNNGYAGSVSLR